MVRAALAMLSDDRNDAKGWDKAASLEMYHHINCLRDAHRTCKITKSNDSPLNDLCDVKILMYLLSSVYTEPYMDRTDMSTMNSI